jgi:hypothetical protein
MSARALAFPIPLPAQVTTATFRMGIRTSVMKEALGFKGKGPLPGRLNKGSSRSFEAQTPALEGAGRSYDAVLAVIGALLKSYPPEEGANYLANCGYRAG